ncbi:MAG: ECF-type sigma factor, partial [Pirellulales bacterium]|nr:ECF-type sigma factor [Pirellulales bacterium]
RQLDEQEIVAAVTAAIGQLPPRQRRAIELVYFQGMSYVRAAEEMETSWKAVKSLLGRGRGALGESLQNEYGRRFELA